MSNTEYEIPPGSALERFYSLGWGTGGGFDRAIGVLKAAGQLDALADEIRTIRASSGARKAVAKSARPAGRDVHFMSGALADFGRLSDAYSTREALTDFANAGRLPELAAAISGLAGRAEAEQAATPAGAIADAEKERDEAARLADAPGLDRDLRNIYLRKSSEAAKRVDDLKGVS